MRRIRDQNPGPKIIVLTTYESDDYIFEAIDSGARILVPFGTIGQSILDLGGTLAMNDHEQGLEPLREQGDELTPRDYGFPEEPTVAESRRCSSVLG